MSISKELNSHQLPLNWMYKNGPLDHVHLLLKMIFQICPSHIFWPWRVWHAGNYTAGQQSTFFPNFQHGFYWEWIMDIPKCLRIIPCVINEPISPDTSKIKREKAKKNNNNKKTPARLVSTRLAKKTFRFYLIF